jgi:hypothetical protein
VTIPTYEDLQARLNHIQDLARDYIKGFPEDKAAFQLAAGILAIAQHAIADPTIPPTCRGDA